MATSNVEVHGKRIAFVSNSAWSVYNFRLDVIQSLIAAGHQVLVFAPADDFSGALRESGCEFVPINFNNKTINPFTDLGFYRQLRKLYNKYRPDFIFHYVAKPNIYGSLAAASCGIPSVAVVTGLGYPFASRNWLFHVMKTLYRIALRNSREVWFLNNDDAKVFTTEKITGIEKMKVLPGEGVNTEHFSPMPVVKNSIYTFIMSTRLLKSKGIMIYADAARILRKKNYDVRFELIGFTEDQHPDSIQKSDLEKWQREGLITYLGFARDVRPFLARAHCFVFPSFYNEGIPRCLMEAAAMELPVITSATKGCRDVVVNHETGYICKTKDAFDLADKMEKMLLLDDQDQRRMGRAGRSYVASKFSVDKIVEEYFTTLYNDLTD
ncbi:MAG: glycosyltransferase family 1 protein [Chitinophagaceae bacterium]|nr:MAG: glycosyltransferase family 1 protein [Chitinophagaceae bacterium]